MSYLHGFELKVENHRDPTVPEPAAELLLTQLQPERGEGKVTGIQRREFSGRSHHESSSDVWLI